MGPPQIPHDRAREDRRSRAVQNWALDCILVSMTTSHFYLLTGIAETLLLRQSTPCWGSKGAKGLQSVCSEYTCDEWEVAQRCGAHKDKKLST